MKDFLLIIVIIMSACSSQQYSQNVIINSEDELVKKEAELFFFDTNLSYEENEKISALFSYRNIAQDAKDFIVNIQNNRNLETENRQLIRTLYNNINRIQASKKRVQINTPFDLDSTDVYLSAYEQPVKNKLLRSNQPISNILSNKLLFCSSYYDEMDMSVIEKLIQEDRDFVLVTDQKLSNFQNNLIKGNISPKKNYFYEQQNPQAFAAEVLGIKESQERFNEIKRISSGLSIEFLPRRNSNLEIIILDVSASNLKRLLPAFNYNYAADLNYYSTSSANLLFNDEIDLNDLEKLFAPIPRPVDSYSKTKEIFSNNHAIISDTILVEVLRQIGVSEALVNGYSGILKYTGSGCIERNIPLTQI